MKKARGSSCEMDIDVRSLRSRKISYVYTTSSKSRQRERRFLLLSFLTNDGRR